jgi:nuclear transport factor 2 (NTF2) superfamily protein
MSDAPCVELPERKWAREPDCRLIAEGDRTFRRPRVRRPDEHPGLRESNR